MNAPFLLENSNEPVRRQESDLGIYPPDERFHAADFFRQGSYDRLEVYFYPSILYCIIDLPDDILARLYRFFKLIREDDIVAPVVILDRIARDLCPAHRSFNIEIRSCVKHVYAILAYDVIFIAVRLTERLYGVLGILDNALLLRKHNEMIGCDP